MRQGGEMHSRRALHGGALRLPGSEIGAAMRPADVQIPQRARVSREGLSTAEAAEFLRVSEASVRRWSDAGLLPNQRLGRKRSRRFAESDLVKFLNRTESASSPMRLAAVEVEGVAISVPSHLATFYSSDSGRLRLTLPFLIEGARLRHHCFLAASDELLEIYLKALRNGGDIDLDRAIAEGRFSALRFDGATVDTAVAFWEEKFADVRSQGSSIIRHVGEMATVRRMFPSEDEMLRFEEAYDVMCRRYRVAAICQYDVREFDGLAMLRVLKAHPDLFERRLGAFLN
jgi:excisionase family DNA binding protein